MTTFLLIRHALHDYGGHRIAGRTPGVHLSSEGKRQAEALAARLSQQTIHALYTSPMERTQETADLIAAGHGLTPQIAPQIIELDFGDWTTQDLEELRPQESWRQFNAYRSGSPAPNGELMLQTQARIVNFMLEIRAQHEDQTVALVSHGDVIKSAVAYFLGVPLDLFQRIEISPASISTIGLANYGPWVMGVNSVYS